MRALLALLLLAGCVPRSVQDRLTALEVRVADLELARSPAPPTGPSVEDEVRAEAALAEAQAAYEAGRVEAARDAFAAVASAWPATAAGPKARRVADELALVGQPAGDLVAVTEWFQGVPPDLAHGRVLLVFFETWCPHCRREVPGLAQRFAGRDVEVVLLTRLTRDSTPEDLRAFLDENDVRLATGRDPGSVAERYQVRGVPAAALVHEGRVAWRGHPARLEGALLEALAPPR